MKREKTACECRRVTYGDIYDAVINGAQNFDDVQKITGCGRGCKKCVEFIEFLIRDFMETEKL